MFDQFAVLKENALRHLAAAADFARRVHRPQVAQQLEEGARHLAANRYNIALIGNMNRGKSTLLNTLLGRSDDNLSPVAAKVCTAAIIQYLSREAHPDKVAEAQVFLEGQPEPLRVPVEAVREYITEEHNPGNEKAVRSVNVFGDFPLLHNVVTLVDTPGRGAVQRHHEVLLDEFLPMADAIIFLIAGDLPIEASERSFLEQLRDAERERIFFVLTKLDEVAARDLPAVREWVHKQIKESGLHCDRLFEVSARGLFEARRTGQDADEIARLHRESGVAELEAELERFIIAKSEKNSALLPRLRALLDEVGNLSNAVASDAESDLAAFVDDTGKIEQELKDLEGRAKELRRTRDKATEKFRRAWARVVSKFCRDFESRATAAADRILEKINKGGLIGTALGSFKIKRLIEDALRREVSVLLPTLDEQLAAAAESLKAEIDTGWETYQRSRAPTGLVTPTASLLGLGGVATAGAGALSSVGAAVAAWADFASKTNAQGALQALWCALKGGGAVNTAATAAMTATVHAAGGIVITFAASWIAQKIIVAVQENRVPELVNSALKTMNAELEKKLVERSQEIIGIYHDLVEEEIAITEERLRDLQQSIASRDPQARPALEARRDEAKQLFAAQRDLAHSLRLLA